MPINLHDYYKRESRTLVWSLRNIQNFIYNSCLFEFEDIIDSVDKVDLIAPPQYGKAGSAVKRLVKTQTHRFKPLTQLNPYFQQVNLAKEYDIFLAILDFPWNVISMNLLKNFRQQSKFAVCYLDELWSSDLPKFDNFLEFLRDFDLICSNYAGVIEHIRQVTDVPCIFLPSGVDAIKFCPDFQTNLRAVDVCSLGRRSQITHEALLKLAEEKQYYYSYDYISGAGMRSNRHQEHRTLTANLLKSSRYYITNYAKVDEPQRIQGQMEIGSRFFEGTAAGAICIGTPPDTDVFKQLFDWENAVIPIAFDEPNIDKIILELDSQPKYLRQISINNAINSLRKHDWVYRWEQVLNELGLPTTPAMEKRKATLEKMARSCELSEVS